MKTTEVFVEQVLIGLLVILNLVLILFSDISDSIKGLDISKAAAVLATAYLVGIIFDRFADTLLEDIEQYSRLKVAIEKKIPPFKEDPFPEQMYRMEVLQNREAFTYANYLRTRIRLSRAIAILIPGLSVSFLLSKASGPISRQWWIVAAVSVGVIYGGALGAQLVRGMEKGKSTKTVWYKIPKTDKLRELEKFKVAERKMWWFIIREPFSWAFTFLTGLGIIIAWHVGWNVFPTVPLLNITLTLLTFWTWWRINKTFLVFLKDHFEYKVCKAPALSERESELLIKINQGLPIADARLMIELIAKRQSYTITEGELQELIRITNEPKGLNVERIKHLLELAHLRGVTLDEVMEQLGIKPAACAASPRTLPGLPQG